MIRGFKITGIQWLTVLFLSIVIISYGSLDVPLLEETLAPKKIQVMIPMLSAVPVVATNVGEPQISASTAVAIDVDSGTVLFSKNPDVALPPASSLKLLTALTARELFSLEEVATVGAYPINDDKQLLRPGMQLSVKELLAALLVSSNNTAAYTLANHAPQGADFFLSRMNAIANRAQLQHTVAFNPAGFDDELSKSSARDLTRLLRLTQLDPVLAGFESTQEQTLLLADGTQAGKIHNTNQLLGLDSRVIAGKTGTTDEAGQVLVTLLHLKDHKVVMVVMGSEDRYAEIQLLADWIEERYTWLPLNFERPVLYTSETFE